MIMLILKLLHDILKKIWVLIIVSIRTDNTKKVQFSSVGFIGTRKGTEKKIWKCKQIFPRKNIILLNIIYQMWIIYVKSYIIRF